MRTVFRVAGTAVMFLLVGVASAGALAGWSIVASPNRGTGVNSLTGVSCRGGSCVAVGFSYSVQAAAYRTLIETEDDGHWSIVPSPSRGIGDNNLLGVSCVSSRWCMAVGFDHASGTDRTLTEVWDDGRWSIVPSPNNGSLNNDLNAVACVSAVSCEAVGWSYDTGKPFAPTLAESWNGARWSIESSPNRSLETNVLDSVSCPSPHSCKAVGDAVSARGTLETLIESWNGTAWSIVASPNNGLFGNDLRGVSCASAHACQAVGEYGNASLTTNQSLIESWNGVKWSIVPSPDSGTKVNVLDEVSCSARNSCQAVGTYFNSGLDAYQNLTESWDGNIWSIVPSSDNGTGYNVLDAVACRPERPTCTAVGNSLDPSSNTYRTLIESTRTTRFDRGK